MLGFQVTLPLSSLSLFFFHSLFLPLTEAIQFSRDQSPQERGGSALQLLPSCPHHISVLAFPLSPHGIETEVE